MSTATPAPRLTRAQISKLSPMTRKEMTDALGVITHFWCATGKFTYACGVKPQSAVKNGIWRDGTTYYDQVDCKRCRKTNAWLERATRPGRAPRRDLMGEWPPRRDLMGELHYA